MTNVIAPQFGRMVAVVCLRVRLCQDYINSFDDYLIISLSKTRMSVEKPKVIFFSRRGYTKIFSLLQSPQFESIHVVYNSEERAECENNGGRVIACLQEQYDRLDGAAVPPRFLRNGFYPDRCLRGLPLHKRQEILGKLITFWRKILEEHKPLVCFHETVAVESDEILSHVCAEKNIFDLTWDWLPVEDRFVFSLNPFSSSIPKDVLDSIEPTAESLATARISVEKVQQKKRPYYYKEINNLELDFNSKTILERFIIYKLTQKLRRKQCAWLNQLIEKYCARRRIVWPRFLRGPTWEKKLFKMLTTDFFAMDFYATLHDDWCRKHYKYDSLDDFKGYRLLAYPLHYEPEATTLYFAPECSDQAALIGLIARNLPLDTVLVVKEHPVQPGRLLTREFLRVRWQNPNVCFLPGTVTNYEILQRCDVITVATGTLGWEALCFGKPVILFGNVYYDKHPHVTKLRHPFDIRCVDFDKLPKPQREDTERYLAKLLTISHEGLIDKKATAPDNVKKVIQALEYEVLRLHQLKKSNPAEAERLRLLYARSHELENSAACV